MKKSLVLALLLSACGGPQPATGEPVQPVRGSLDQTLQIHQKGAPIFSMAFSPDGRWLATASADASVKITDWKSPTRELVTTIAGPKEVIAPYPVAWTLDGKYLLIGGDGVHVVQASDWKEISQLKGTHSWVYAIATANCGGKVVIATTGGSDMNLSVWDPATWQAVKTLKVHEGKIYAAVFDEAGSTLATGSWDRSVKFFRTDTWETTVTLSKISASVFSAAFLPGGRSLITGAENGEVKCWDFMNPDQKASETIKLLRHSDAVTSITVNRAANLLATGGCDRRIYLYDLWEGQVNPLRQYTTGGPRVYSLSTSADGRHLLAGCEDGTLRVWVIPSRPPR
jgi:WD40 repeat protein